jgi:hypothetical protein
MRAYGDMLSMLNPCLEDKASRRRFVTSFPETPVPSPQASPCAHAGDLAREAIGSIVEHVIQYIGICPICQERSHSPTTSIALAFFDIFCSRVLS